MRPELSKRKTARGRIVAHVAHIGPIVADGPTPQEASERCETATLDALARLAQGAEIRRWRGHVAVIVPTSDGWGYWLDTSTQASIQHTSTADRAAMICAAMNHLAQNLWTADVDDREFVKGLPDPSPLVGWMRFQRAYAKAKADGVGDSEAHRFACEAL